ncbi:M20/M25/M40 family metallo-hydrolase [bacterium]|nr:M20/M25/M40 family metallo-hydrolase [bacterium]
MLDLLAKLVSIRSLSREEHACADFVESWARNAGFRPKRIGNNIVFELGGGPRRLMLNSHIDTVPQCSGWLADPWTPRLADGRLTGLGANDAKGCVAAMLLAARELEEQGWDGPGTLVVLISAEEEIGGESGIQLALSQIEPVEAAINGEPTGLAPCNAQRGMLLLNCHSQGSSGHAAHAHALGLENAVHSAARDIVRLSEMQFEPYEGIHVSRPQVTVVSGGLSHNQVPDNCDFQVDLRTTPNLDHDATLEYIRGQLECEVRCRSMRYMPASTAADHPIVRAAVAASGKQTYFSNTCSDWSLYGGIPTVKLGPGESERSHRPEEFILATELEQGVRVYRDTVLGYFGEVGHV